MAAAGPQVFVVAVFWPGFRHTDGADRVGNHVSIGSIGGADRQTPATRLARPRCANFRGVTDVACHTRVSVVKKEPAPLGFAGRGQRLLPLGWPDGDGSTFQPWASSRNMLCGRKLDRLSTAAWTVTRDAATVRDDPAGLPSVDKTPRSNSFQTGFFFCHGFRSCVFSNKLTALLLIDSTTPCLVACSQRSSSVQRARPSGGSGKPRRLSAASVGP